MGKSSHNNDTPKPMMPYHKHYYFNSVQKILDELNVTFLLMPLCIENLCHP